MSKKAIVSGLFVLAVSICLSGVVMAQEITGSIVGTVRDSNGAAVPNATVKITDPSKGNLLVRTVVTNSDGEYSAPNLPTNTFSVTVEAPNFKKHVSNGVKIDVGQHRQLDVTLEAGKIDETVTVTADTVGVELTSPSTGTTINGAQIRELSINNRNWVQLIAIAPGVSNDLADQVYVGTTNPQGQANTINISVNGGRSSQNTFTVDGSDVTDRGSNITIQAYPSLDSIGEFKVLRSLYPAESGRSGGGQVNVVTRSGEKKFHGSLYEFVRNDVLNANDFLTNSTATPPFGRNTNGLARRAPFHYNDFGWTFSGPVFGLNFGEHDPGDSFFRRYKKTFFFYSEEVRRDSRFSAAATVNVPDAASRMGVFPIDVCINRNNQPAENCTVGNPGRLTAGTPIPAAFYSPAALAYLTGVYNKLPLPNNPAINPYALTTAIANVANFRQEIIKIDHSFSDKASAYYRFENDNIPTIDGNALFSSGSGLPGVSTTSTNSPGKTHTFQLTYAARPNLIFEGRFNYGYGAILSQNIGTLALANTTVPITLPFVNQRDRIPSLGGATNNGFAPLTSFGPYNNFSYKRNETGSVTWIIGNHTLKFGGVFSQYRKNENALAGSNEGLFTNSFGSTLASGVASSTINSNLARWANFLVGNVLSGTFQQASFDYTADLRQKTIEGFAQDEWRARPNLTLYIGVRYSYFGSPYDKNGRLSNFEPSLFDPASRPQVNGLGARVIAAGVNTGNWCNGIIVNSQNLGPAFPNCTPTASPYGKYVIKVSKRDFAPRVGFVWDPFKKGTTSVRMGYGIYHEQVLNGTFEQNIGQNPPYQLTASNPAASRLDAPTAGIGTTAFQSLRAVQTNWKTPYMQHWSLDVQHQFDKNTVVTVGYFGSKGTHLIGITELNDIAPGVALNSLCAPGNTYYAQTPAPTLVACQPPGYVFRNAGSATVIVPENPNVQPGTGVQSTDILILDQIRPYRGYRSIAIIQPRYNSNYHSLQVSAVHRFGGSSQVNLAYTWSKNLTDNQTDRSTAPQDSYNLAGDKSRATLDRRHVFNVNYVYELPFYKGRHDLTANVLGGWQVSGIFSYLTGIPFTVTTSNFDPAGTGLINANPTARPILLCDPNANAPHTLAQYFNIACFQPNPSNTTNTRLAGFQNVPGNAGRGIINGPPTARVDFTLSKNISFGERYKLQIRGEAFNVFNHTNFRSFSSLNITSSVFGVVGVVRDPRTIQLGAKFSF